MEKINNFEEFKTAVKNFITAELPDCDIEIIDVPKNNGIYLSGITVYSKGTKVSPTIYLETYYDELQSDKPFDEISSEIICILEKGMKEAEHVNINTISNFDLAKDKICYRLINKSANKELLKAMPHKDFYDLAIVYYIMLDSTDTDTGISSIKITNSMIQHWGVDEGQIHILACKNTPILNWGKVMPMEDVMSELADIIGISSKGREHITTKRFDISFAKNHGASFYIATNINKLNGAGVILYEGLLQTVSQKLGPLFVLPSSVHECVLVPGKLNDAESMLQIVREANQTAVSKTEFLSNNCYYFYDAKNNGLQMIS